MVEVDLRLYKIKEQKFNNSIMNISKFQIKSSQELIKCVIGLFID